MEIHKELVSKIIPDNVSKDGTTSVSTATNGSKLMNRQKPETRSKRAFSGNAKRIPLETTQKSKLPEIKNSEKPKLFKKQDSNMNSKEAAKFGEAKKFIGSFTESQKGSNNGKTSVIHGLDS